MEMTFFSPLFVLCLVFNIYFFFFIPLSQNKLKELQLKKSA